MRTQANLTRTRARRIASRIESDMTQLAVAGKSSDTVVNRILEGMRQLQDLIPKLELESAREFQFVLDILRITLKQTFEIDSTCSCPFHPHTVRSSYTRTWQRSEARFGNFVPLAA